LRMPFITIASRRSARFCASKLRPVHHFLSQIPNPRLRLAVMTVYYLLIIGAVIYVQIRENFTTPAFIYQNF
jgi:hypothetical protein